MDNLKTYNRVKELESKKARTFLFVCYISSIIVAIGGLAALFFNKDLWTYSAIAATTAIILARLIYMIDNRREKSCQFCGNILSYITRPFLLKGKYLSMHGVKEGNYFFTQRTRKTSPFKKCWTKISNRSLACHHCRLSEETYSEYYEPPSEKELTVLEDC